MLYILGEGQSNCLMLAPAFQATKFPAGVTMWNNGQGIDSPTAQLGNAWVSPNALPYGNTMMAHAARRISEAAGHDVRLILNARGSTPSTAWSEANHAKPVGPAFPGNPYAMFVRKQAIMAAAGVTRFDGFLWHQGESDKGASHYYYKRFWGHIHLMRILSMIDDNTPVGIGEVANIPGHGKILAVQRSLPNYDPHILTGIAPLASLPVVTPSVPPSPHFTSESVAIAGVRMANTILPRLQGLVARGLVGGA